ncbi:MAG: hypothetical protein V4850_33380 [Myxococcota bacterium]
MTSLLFSLLVGCGEPEPVVTAPPVETTVAPEVALPPQVARAVELAKAVLAQPNDTEAALASKGGTPAELEGLLYEIAGEPALTEAYATGMAQ